MNIGLAAAGSAAPAATPCEWEMVETIPPKWGNESGQECWASSQVNLPETRICIQFWEQSCSFQLCQGLFHWGNYASFTLHTHVQLSKVPTDPDSSISLGNYDHAWSPVCRLFNLGDDTEDLHPLQHHLHLWSEWYSNSPWGSECKRFSISLEINTPGLWKGEDTVQPLQRLHSWASWWGSWWRTAVQPYERTQFLSCREVPCVNMAPHTLYISSSASVNPLLRFPLNTPCTLSACWAGPQSTIVDIRRRPSWIWS